MEINQFTRIGTLCEKCSNVICNCAEYEEKVAKAKIEFKQTELEQAIKVLQKHFELRIVKNGLTPQIRNSEKLNILKSIANAGKIDWEEVEENGKIISLQLRTF